MKNAAWFQKQTHCQVTGLPVRHPECFRDESAGGDYGIELAILGSYIILIRASGYATARNMDASIAFVDDYLSRHVPARRGLVFIEDYALVAGADSQARKKYIEYNRNSGIFEGAVVYNLPTLFKFSLKLARRLQIHDIQVRAVDSYQEAVAEALDILKNAADRFGANGETGTDDEERPASTNGNGRFHGLGDMLSRIRLRTQSLLWGGYNAISRGLMEKYTEELLKHIESIDWQIDGVQPAKIDVGPGHPFRKVYDAISFIKSEIDRLLAERIQAEQSLRESEVRYRHLVEYAKAGILEIDLASQKLVSINEAVVAVSRYSREELLSTNYLDLFSEANRAVFKERLNRILAGDPVEDDLEFQFMTKQGDLKCMLLNSHINTENGRPSRATVVMTDITRIKESENRLRDFQDRLRGLSKELTMSEEKQRRLLAAQLHDRVSQELAVANILINSFERALEEPEHLSRLREIRRQIVKVIEETRSLTFDLSPPVLYDLGLEEAVEWLAEKIEETHHMGVEIRCSGVTKAIDDEIKIILFRNIKELMHNAVKHAQAAHIFVEISQAGSSLRVEVKDDGVGFEVDRLAGMGQACQGFGLFNIKEKLNHLGGALDIRSAQGRGTSVIMTVPLTQPAGAGDSMGAGLGTGSDQAEMF